jgi:hypothetical protein
MAAAPLRLRAEDADDLAVISAALQDAAFVLRDLAFHARERRFVATVNRFRWETAKRLGPWERVRTVFAVETVLAARSRKVRVGADDATGALLDVAFEPGEPPGGAIRLRLAGGGEIELDVECIDVTFTDVSAPWPTGNRPDHEKA